MSATRKGGGHSRGQTKPYGVVYAWKGGKPSRTAEWTLGSAKATLTDILRSANRRESTVEAYVVDRATGAAEKIQDGAGVPYLYAYDKDELDLD